MTFQRWTSSVLLFTGLINAICAQLVPTTPGPNETYAVGSACTIAWKPDISGRWKNVSIDLMSGSNINMSLVTNVITALDGTDSSMTPYNWTCPEVAPYSNIYFYQFTDGNNISTRTWTTRFTITSPNNETVPPPNIKQPNGDSVPWGNGHLLSKSAGALSSAYHENNDTSSTSANSTSTSSSEESDRKHKHREDNESSSDDSRGNGHGDVSTTRNDTTESTSAGRDRNGSTSTDRGREENSDTRGHEESSTGTKMQTARISDALAAASRASYIEHHTPLPGDATFSMRAAQASPTAASGDVPRSQTQRDGTLDESGAGSSACQCGYALQSGAESVLSVVSASFILIVSLFIAVIL